MPPSLSFIEAGSVPFAALTAWSALVGHGGLNESNLTGKRVLVVRGAGGVGTFAIQLLKAWGAYVVTTCSTPNVDYLQALGADQVIDYSRVRIEDAVHDIDAALDSAFDTETAVLSTLRTHVNAVYVTIVSPKLRLIDEYGMQEGTRRAEAQLAERKADQAKLGRQYHWGFMRPDGAALATISNLIETGKIRPFIDTVFPLDQIVQAHQYCESGKARGKIVLNFDN